MSSGETKAPIAHVLILKDERGRLHFPIRHFAGCVHQIRDGPNRFGPDLNEASQVGTLKSSHIRKSLKFLRIVFKKLFLFGAGFFENLQTAWIAEITCFLPRSWLP